MNYTSVQQRSVWATFAITLLLSLALVLAAPLRASAFLVNQVDVTYCREQLTATTVRARVKFVGQSNLVGSQTIKIITSIQTNSSTITKGQTKYLYSSPLSSTSTATFRFAVGNYTSNPSQINWMAWCH